MNLFQWHPTPVTLHSGESSFFLIDAEALTYDDLDGLARLVAGTIPYRCAYGVPRGGLRFAQALQAHALGGNGPFLLVDDVYTTGASLREEEARLALGVPMVKIVIFARRTPTPDVHAIFTIGPPA